MPITIMSFKNPFIAAYFNHPAGKNPDAAPPVSEFMYLHTHPLIQSNFLAEIEVMVNTLDPKKLPRSVAERIANHTTAIAKLLPDVNEDTAKSVLQHLREVYRLAKAFIA
jgi:hypothetical protein